MSPIDAPRWGCSPRTRAQVLDHLVRVQHVGAHLVSPAGAAVALQRVDLGLPPPGASLQQLWPAARHREALFCSWERSFWQDTTMPVGMWVSGRRVGVLTPWPRGRRADRRRPAVPSRRCRCGRSARPPHHPDAGERGLPAALVVDGEMRTRRCVPCSTDSVSVRVGALTWNVRHLMPASSA